jgi:cytochrome c-type biogenesis protein CcmH
VRSSLALVLLLCLSTLALGDEALDRRVANLAHELRCLVCQNQSLAESNAPLAQDLRNEIREQMAAGKSDQDVIDFMVQRYGDFVLYRPPFKASTFFLWAGPFLFLVLGFFLLFRFLRTRRLAPPQLSDVERARADKLLE